MTGPLSDAQLEALWHAAVAANPPCLCGHGAVLHGASGRCGSAACGCIVLRPRAEARAPQPPADPPTVARTSWSPCPSCNGTGNELASTDPDWRWYWCSTCWGVGVIEVEQ